MQDSKDTLRDAVNSAFKSAAGHRQASFERLWQKAEQQHAASRRRYRWFAGTAATAAAVVIALNLHTPAEQDAYIEIAELLDSTYWSAPSDVLLPDREFDIYQDLPVLFESTEPAEGALL
jgi:uncharacterized membrane protein